ncbi:MAG: glycosyltransferase family 2 protein [Prolixibacteraceae bacterium]
MYNPKISIITITYNSSKTVEQTILSVINQSYSNFEYLIIDGGSTDQTLEVVNQYKAFISLVISEKDKGISDAFNKGIAYASGDIVGIINSDDYLLPDSLSKVAAHYDSKIDVYRGNLVIWNQKENSKFQEIPSLKFPTIPFGVHVCHPSTFITKNAYGKFGKYSLDLKYMMDTELLTRFYKNGARFKYIDFDMAMFRIGGATSISITKKKREIEKLITLNGGSHFQIACFYNYLVIKELFKNLLNLFGRDFRLKLKYKRYPH